VLAAADLVLAASRTHAETMGAGSGGRTGRVLHLPNGYAPEPQAEPAAAGERASHFLLAFTGTLSQMPETEVLLEAIHDLLARRPELRRKLRARLAGPYDLGYEDRAVALGLRGIVEFTGSISHRESRALQRSADLLLLWKPPSIPTMVPGKLYEYLESGRPIAALLPPGEEAAELAERGGATRIAPGDRAALAAEIERHVDRWLANGREPDRRLDWLESHSRPRIAERLAGELNALVSGSRP
jgi:glycosyltransferase involved in cell wall biosynthesis